MRNIYLFLILMITTFITTVVTTKQLIPLLTKKKIGQKILEIGPNWHKNKEGTPTMGGMGFIIAIIASFVFFCLLNREKESTILLNIIIYALLNGLIGIIDDVAKFKKTQNEGLKPRTKFVFQSICAILFLFLLYYTVGIDTALYIPYIDISINVGILYYPLAFLVLCGFVNAVNLTDGVDGLASSIVLTVGCFASYVGTFLDNSIVLFIGASLIGSMLGFLLFNKHPARIFMGDTGSLFLGAIVVSLSFVLNNILLVLIYGFIFFVEAISDILQVFIFKISGKRIFKMAPLHHHFEKSGWSEIKISYIFMLINLIFCVLAFFGLRIV